MLYVPKDPGLHSEAELRACRDKVKYVRLGAEVYLHTKYSKTGIEDSCLVKQLTMPQCK